MENQEIYNLYKPFRNQLRKLDIFDSLWVIWSYFNSLQLGAPIPPEIETIELFRTTTKSDGEYVQRRRLVQEQHLEIMAREIIAESENGSSQNSFRRYGHFARSINHLKKFDDDLSGILLEDPKKIWFELMKISHLQFPWQSGANQEGFIRYYQIFKNPNIDTLLKKKINLSAEEIFTCGLALFGMYTKFFSYTLPINTTISILTNEKVALFLDYFSITSEEMKDLIIRNRKIDEGFFVGYEPLRDYPLIKINNLMACPSITLFFWRITKGLFFDLIKEPNFDNYYGESFENYVEEAVKISNKSKRFIVHKQKTYGKSEKRPTDFILESKNEYIFLECKTKRLPFYAMASESDFEKQIEILADQVAKVYRFIVDFENDDYTHLKCNRSKKIYPIIVTLEDWYLMGERYLLSLRDRIIDLLKAKKIDISIIDKYPYSLCSIHELERLIFVLQYQEPSIFLDTKIKNKEYSRWTYFSFMEKNYDSVLRKFKPRNLLEFLPETITKEKTK